MTLSAAIMAHPSRADMVDELLSTLDRPVKVVWDEKQDRHDTGIRAMEAFDPSCSHHLVIQDDVLPCADLLAGTERALKYVPQDVPLSLYLGRVKPFRHAVTAAVSKAHGASWITMNGIYWGPGIVLPTAVIPEMSAWFRRATVTNYDRRMSRWFESRKIRCWYTWPSLVDHRGDESLVKGHGPGRHAHRVHVGSALDVDWTGPVVEMQGTQRLDQVRQRRTKVNA
jgi:hypothetical protein